MTSSQRTTASYSIVFTGLTLQIGLQFVLQLLLARIYGAAEELDAYLAALAMPVALSALVAGTLSPVVITHSHRNTPRVDPALFQGRLVALVAVGTATLAALGALFGPHVMPLIEPGDPAAAKRAVSLFRILIWLLPANALIGLFQAILNTSLNFSLPALAGVLGPLTTVLIVAAFATPGHIEVLAGATLAGAIVNVLIQLPGVGLQVRLRAQKPGTQTWPAGLTGMAAPIFLSMLLLKLDPIVDVRVCSQLVDGSLSRLGYASRILMIFVMLASGTLSTVAFPRIARQSLAGGRLLADELLQGLRTLIVLVVPGLAVLAIFGEPLVHDLFERGAFSASDTRVVAMLLRAFAVTFAGAALGELCAKSLYALHKPMLATWIGGTALLLGFALKLWIVPQAGLIWLPWITSGVYALSAALQLWQVRRRVPEFHLRRALPELAQSVLATVVAIVAGMGVLQSAIAWRGIIGLAAGAIAYLAVMVVFQRRKRRRFVD